MPSLLDVRRTIAALIAVALSAALIAFAFIVSDSYTTRMRADARLSLGGADAVVVPARPSEGGGPLDDAVIAQLSDLDGVASVRGEHWDIIYSDLPRQLANAVGAIVVRDVPALSERTTLTAGRLPQGAGEVAIDTSLAEKWELGVGDVIRLKNNESGDIRTGPTVVGIVSPGPDAGLDDNLSVVYATVDQLAAMGASTAYYRLYVDAKPGVSTGDLVSEVERVVHAVQPAASVVDADAAVAQRAAASQSGGTMITMVMNLLAPVCAVVAAIVIATTFAALVARQTRTTGLLRCIGATRRQVMGAVLRTAALTGVIGSVLGAGLGAGAAALLVRSGVIEDLDADQLTITPLSLVVTIAVGTLVTLIAVLLPARRASRVSPLVAITGQTTGAKQAGRARRWAAIAGAVIALAGTVVTVMGATGQEPYLVAGGGVVVALGILLTLSLLVSGAVGLIGRLGDAERRPILHLAARNLERNPGRSAANAATLFVCALVGSTLFVGLFSITSSYQSIVNRNSSAIDITVLGVTPQTDAAALTSTIRAVNGVQDTVLVPSLDLTQTVDGKTRPIDVLSIDTAAIAPVVHSTEEFEGLDNNTLIVGALHDIPDGAPVTLTGPAGSTTLTARVRSNFAAAVITPAAAERLTGGAPTDAMMWVRTTGNGSSQGVEDAVRQAVRGQELMVVGSAQGRDAFVNLLHRTVLTVCLVMAAALVISLSGLANTTDISVLERTREIGVLRATGTTRPQIRRLITTEAALLALVGGVLGIIVGTALGKVGLAALGNNFGIEVALPWLPLAGLLAVTLLIGVAASLRPAGRAAAVTPITALAAD
ncbi:ABC transporter permease [Actinomyces sp. oral taxon 414]|uniref:FtsX-like permease family protein n=1 Tax=Actinomyces sp. oral taxon 414 TaxID=712122 RepID=UPI0006AE1E31|nr:FtsX-like permease family protein [Actinomyces sp. oral taxon 414]ALD00257.1 ABC transporter permease [Actinomyces sp. oral taxon 414]